MLLLLGAVHSLRWCVRCVVHHGKCSACLSLTVGTGGEGSDVPGVFWPCHCRLSSAPQLHPVHEQGLRCARTECGTILSQESSTYLRRTIAFRTSATNVRRGVLIKVALGQICRCYRLATMLISTLAALQHHPFEAYRNVAFVFGYRNAIYR
jgi:hypothetical protein